MPLKFYLKQIRESKFFSNLTTGVIIFYASILGIKTIKNIESQFEYFLYLLDYTITLYFLIEIIIKISSEKNLLNFFKSGWNIFDFLIVLVTLIPLDNTQIVAIARLLRIFRVLRLITSRPELKQIIDMIIKAIPSIIDIVILMFIIFYIYAIIGNFLFISTPSGLWDDFLISMLTLFRILTFEDWTDVMYEAMEVYPWAWVYFVSFVIIAGFVFFNLFIAVIVGEMEKVNNQKIKEEIHDDGEKLDLILTKIEALQKEIAILKEEEKKTS